MSFFSRTSDIISRNLLDLLARETDPARASRGVIAEIEQGLAGIRRSVQTATRNEERIAAELTEHRGQVTFWTTRAREELGAGHEPEARAALLRKKELEDLLAGLQQEHLAAQATRDQLTTTQRAVEARLAEAKRLQSQLDEGLPLTALAEASQLLTPPQESLGRTRAAELDDELEALRREMNLT